MAERLHDRMNAVLARTPYPIRCSTGVLLLEPGAGGATEADIDLADRLMYQAKLEGRAALRIGTRATLPTDGHRERPALTERTQRRAA